MRRAVPPRSDTEANEAKKKDTNSKVAKKFFHISIKEKGKRDPVYVRSQLTSNLRTTHEPFGSKVKQRGSKSSKCKLKKPRKAQRSQANSVNEYVVRGGQK